MPSYQRLLDYNEMFSHLSAPPIFINDLANITSVDRENIRQMVTTRYSSDMVSLLPQCRCGVTKGEFNTVNTICHVCGTPVRSAIENTIEPQIWFRKPNGVERLLPTIVMIMLKNRLKKSGYSILQWLIDTNYSPQVRKPDVLSKIMAAGLGRGYNNFIRNFMPYMEFLLSLSELRPKNSKTDWLWEFLKVHHHILLADQIPMIHRSILIIENTSVGTYVDAAVLKAVDAIEMLVSIDRDFYDQSGPAKENRTARAMLEYADFFEMYLKNSMAGKPGALRKNLGGARYDFSGRGVITSVTGRHNYDAIEVPWGMGLVLFMPMIKNKLMHKSGFSKNDTDGILLGHIHKYHPLIDQYLKEIIAESPNGRYPVIFNRFPSLLQGSIQRMWIPFIKTDPADKSIGVSILSTTAPNASKSWPLVSKDSSVSYLTAGTSHQVVLRTICNEALNESVFIDYRKAA